MPVFTLAAEYIVSTFIIGAEMGVATAGLSFVTSAIAVTLATVTSRLINGTGGGSGGTTQDQGVRIQFPPATSNKIPIVYGHAFQKGMVTDARISNSNQTMTYVLQLSEKTQTGTFTVGNIYWNDQKLVFNTDAGYEHVVASSIDQNGNGSSNTNFDGLIRIRVYSGDTNSSSQIFPLASTGNTENAKTTLGESDINYLLSDLVFAVIQIDYNSSKGVTGLAQMTFELTNSLINPGEVWYDYMTSARYGAGIDSSQIDTDSCIGSTSTSLKSISNQIPANQQGPVSFFYASIVGTLLTVDTQSGAYPITGTIEVGQVLSGTQIGSGYTIISLGSGTGGEGTYNLDQSGLVAFSSMAGNTTSTQPRYQINGVISTGDTVKNNLDRITLSSAAWTNFDYSQGRWKVIPNRAATTDELDHAFVFTDDNILGDIGITATNLEDLYNLLEIEYASRRIRDQNDYYRAEIDPAVRNLLEPDNTLSLRLDMVNNALHAARIGLIELKQSRIDLIITFRADYSALQCQAGDVVKIISDVYGFNNKLFRITKVREVEDEQGGITVDITALQYNASVYTDEILIDSPDVPGSGIPSFGGSSTLAPPSAPVISAVTTNTNTTTAQFKLSTTIPGNSSPVNEIQWWYNTTSTGAFSYLTNEYNSTGGWVAGNTITDTITILGDGTYYFKARSGNGTSYSNLSSISAQFVWRTNG